MQLALVPNGAVPTGSFDSIAQFEAEARACAPAVLVVDLETNHQLDNSLVVEALIKSSQEAVVGLATARCTSAEMRFRQAALRLQRRRWRVANGEAGFEELRSIVNSIVRSKGNTGPILTDRQQQVLHLVASGMSNSEIAERLAITNGTVKRHVHDCLQRLGARTRLELIVRAHRLSIVQTIPEFTQQEI
ncbi:LuxR C-terminal-related transcriptional regulator [Agromyces mediolanus]|uniref:helix-turn-helix transcriptional regulator n=1 Tax=Agromyces mediolanus TaxID=41986 RepID=UPI00203D5083|nr:LuxR C-terminal-related transcriptional regulator [Agromyces mediolanus]MCM3658838.1 LuxR C-terminal-related transcriptional regulator [Agromyces mediolanus]